MNMVSTYSSQAIWHVIYSKPKQEFRALEHLANQGYDCFLPTLHDGIATESNKCSADQPLFSRYLFVRLDPLSGKWCSIKSTRGVSGLVKFGERFATLPDEVIEALKNGPRTLSREGFTSGERVEIKDGPFGGLEGVYQASDGQARAFILIEMLRQPQKLSFPKELLRRATGRSVE
ncbi:MAG: Transcription antitermination protein nusG [Herminiimonas sp.]|nr:Transcription antitermination protein nusG [Herminiimonas sp.]